MDTTIKDIAQRLDVSYATVSRALNHKKGVKAETKRRVFQAARELNYRPNAIARGLVKKRTHSIGLVIPDITNPFFPEIARGIEDGASQAGYSVFLCNTNWEPGKELEYLNLLLEKRVDGIIWAPISSPGNAREDALDPSPWDGLGSPGPGFRGGVLPASWSSRIPVVYVDKAPRQGNCSFVMIDNIRGGFLAARHLIESGYMSIGFIGAPEASFSLDERLQGYRRALEKYGLAVERRHIRFGDFKRETGYNIIRKMIEQGDCPRAILAENDLLALGIMQGVKEAGLSVPGDVAVVGFDDIPIASFPEIQLTTISQPKYRMGELAVEILLEKMAGNHGQGARKVILEPELIVRGSS